MLLADELATRLVPITLAEGAYARNRPAADRPPYPKVGDRVWFRRNEWDDDGQLHPMTVAAVQDPQDQTSQWAPNLWQTIRDNTTGAPVTDAEGRPLIVPVADPWPWVHLAWPDAPPAGPDWAGRVQMTWESRVRGAAGWLPLDYRDTRTVRLPRQILTQPLPTHRVAPAGWG